MVFTKATSDAYADFITIREVLEASGIEVLSGEAGDGLLTITTELDVPDVLLAELGLTRE